MNCDWVAKSLALFLYGELTFEEEEAVHKHLETCEQCRAAADRERALHGLLSLDQVEAPAGLLAECRATLRERLESEKVPHGLFRRFWEWTGYPVSPVLLRPIAALALVALGFVSARLVPSRQAPGRPPEAEPAVAAVRTLEPDNAGGVRVVVDETRQRVLSGPLDDARIERLLLQAAQSPADPMLRLDSVDLLRKRSQSPEVRRALLRAARRDPNPVVRLRAIEGLGPYGLEPEVRSTLSQVLLGDDNVAIRVKAVDLLVRNQGADIVGVLQEVMQREEDDYIRQRSQEALHVMNASLETF